MTSHSAIERTNDRQHKEKQKIATSVRADIAAS